jgi:hypothetical protein
MRCVGVACRRSEAPAVRCSNGQRARPAALHGIRCALQGLTRPRSALRHRVTGTGTAQSRRPLTVVDAAGCPASRRLARNPFLSFFFWLLLRLLAPVSGDCRTSSVDRVFFQAVLHGFKRSCRAKRTLRVWLII